MELLWPRFLFLLGLIPLLIAAYIWVLRRRRRFTVRYSSLALVREALPHSSRLRRHLPFALFLLAIASLVIASGRPVDIVSVPTDQTTIILVIDASGSMRSTDIQPSRLGAAEAAAISFIQRQKSQTQIGVVAFAGSAELIQAPTTDQEALQIVTDVKKQLDAGGDFKALAERAKSLNGVKELLPGPDRTVVLDLAIEAGVKLFDTLSGIFEISDAESRCLDVRRARRGNHR